MSAVFFIIMAVKDNPMQSQKIQFSEEKETLLVTLFSKAWAARQTPPLLEDAKAIEMVNSIDYDFSRLHISHGTIVTMALRAKRMDEYVRAYLGQSEAPLVLHLGCGLDSRISRVAPASGRWYDLDYPEVIDLRRHFFTKTEHYRMIPSSVIDWGWLDKVESQPQAFIIAEGLVMYLNREDVVTLFSRLQERFPGSEICFDAYSTLTANNINRHPSIKKTGAKIYWGVDDAREIESWVPGMRLLEEWYFTQSQDIDHLPLVDRLLFKITGAFEVVNKAHRVLRFAL